MVELLVNGQQHNFGTHEALVTNQAVEARPGIAGVRWYEVRRVDGQYSVYQQGTYAPDDGVNRWMGSAAMDRDATWPSATASSTA